MPFKNIAKYGYQQTVAGTWDLGHGVTIRFDIKDARAKRFMTVISGPTTAHMNAQNRAEKIRTFGVSGPGPDGAKYRPTLSGPGAAAFLILNGIRLFSAAASLPEWTVINRTSFALGAPIYHGSNNRAERYRNTFRSALEKRGTRGLGDLSWVAKHYMDVVDSGPYFQERYGRKWWEAGMIVIPQKMKAAMGGTATVPTDVLLRVRTDLYGKNLYLDTYSTYNHKVTRTASGIYQKVQAQFKPLSASSGKKVRVRTIEHWEY